jgi:hypothetical protein
LETDAKLLKLREGIFSLFSKCSLKLLNNQADFDSAIRRFDPSRPSQPLSKGDKTYANIQGALLLPNGMAAVELSNETRLIDVNLTPHGEIEKLPEFIQNKAHSSEE